MPARLSLALAVALAVATTIGAQGRSTLVLLATAGDYPGETYTEGPLAPAEFAFFEGEPIVVDVSVANWGPRVSTVDASQTTGPVVRALALGDGRVVAEGQLTSAFWRDGIGGSEHLLPTAAMAIEPGDGVRWRVRFDANQFSSGFYRLVVDLPATDEFGNAVRRERPDFVVEVRRRSAAQPAELARRVAEWWTAQDEREPAHAAVDELERVYPDSVAVHLIRSRLAEAAGDTAGAQRALAVALRFMRADRDILFRRFARPGQIEDLIDSLMP